MAEWPYNTQAWQWLRNTKLATDPLCEYCPPDVVEPATQVDQIIPISEGGSAFAWSNLKSTCASCHSRKARHIDVLGKDHVPVKGVDAKTGRPLDPGHWWNKP